VDPYAPAIADHEQTIDIDRPHDLIGEALPAPDAV
jgi:hypothetical protein